MKKLFITLAACFALSIAQAQQCKLQMAPVVDASLTEGMPEVCVGELQNALERIITANDMTRDVSLVQFVLTAKVSVIDKHATSTAPVQYVNNLGFTFYVADALNSQKYASCYIEADGVGKTEQKSYINAFRNLSRHDAQLRNFMASATKKVMAYYDKQYPQIIKEAQNKERVKDYEGALALLAAVPTCCAGYDKAMDIAVPIYDQYKVRMGTDLLAKAQAIWAGDQTISGAKRALALIAMIDQDAPSFHEAVAVREQIMAAVRIDTDYELKKKYEDRVSIEEQKIDAIKAIGVAYGQGQASNPLIFLR